MGTKRRIAFVAPRFLLGKSVGGAETLLRRLAEHLATHDYDVDFLTTCAQDHFTWANAIEPGTRRVGPLNVYFFPVDEDRNKDSFLAIQDRICHGAVISREEELEWHRNNINSKPLYDYLRKAGKDYHRIIMGPYLFGLIYSACLIQPDRTWLLPCLHDEPFARLTTIREMFHTVAGCLFNALPERDLAVRLYDITDKPAHIVGLGIDDFTADAKAFRCLHKIESPFLIYSGRREPLKGTPLLLDYVNAFRQRTQIDLRLVLTGTGPIDPPPSLAPYVLDLGFVTETEKHNAMAAALAFCHPSVNESLSIVLLEAWLAGTPALVHAGGEVMPYHCRLANGGFWFRNYPEFEEFTMLLIAQPDMRRNLGVNGRQYVLRNYNWETIGQRLCVALT